MKWLKELGRRYHDHHISAYSAQMAFFLTLSVFPFLVVLFTFIGRFSISSESVFNYARLFVPEDIALFLKDFISSITINTRGIISVSIIFSLWSSSKAVHSVTDALNIAFEVEEKKGFFFLRLTGMLYNLLLVFSIIMFLLLPIFGKAIFDFVTKFIVINEFYFRLYSYLKWVLMVVFFFMINLTFYRMLPNIKLKFKDVIYGAIFTSTGWILNALLYSYVITNFTRISIVYGGISILILLSVWLHINAIFIMIGGEINSMLYMRKNVVAEIEK